MILHLCGNLGSGKTTTAHVMHVRARWPVVSVGRVRNMVQDEDRVWEEIVPRLWRAWDSPSLIPGRTGIWVSTGLNWRELVAWERHAPRYVFRVWLTAPVAVLRQRFSVRQTGNEGYWPYQDTAADLLERFLRYDSAAVPLPWPTDLQVNTATMPVEDVVDLIISRCRRGIK